MKKIIFLMISILAITVPSISAEEAYPAGITFDGDTLIWENGGNAELQRLSADEPWTTIYNGSDGSYTDNDSDGMRYYRVKTDGEDEWKYSYAKFNSDSAYCIYGWDYYESNTSGNLEYSAGKTDAGTYKIEKTSAYASSDYAGICQNVESELLESGKSYTLSFDHKRVGGTTSYNQIYYTVGGTRTAISPSKGQTVDWKTTTKTFTCSNTEDFSICFYIVGVGASIELDNIRFYASDDENQTNLLVNGDFEIDIMSPEPPEKVTVLSDDNVISWISDNGIVISDAITDYPVAVFSPGKRIGKPDAQSSAYIIRSYSNDGIMSEPYLLSSDKESFITEPSFSAVSAEGTVSVGIKVKNADVKEGMPVGLYTALYREGALCSISGIKQIVPYTGSENSYTAMKSVLNVPDDTEGYEIKAFVWSGINTMDPLTASKKLD